MNWLGRIFHRHKWEHMETHRLLPFTDYGRGFIINYGGRDFHFRQCSECQRVAQYYPNDEQAATIRADQIFIIDKKKSPA